MQPIIEIRGLGKKYRVTDAPPYLSLRDIISDSIKNVFKPFGHRTKEFWALQDINITIEPGERLGIIGRNGAGKSTLLKILSRITPPTLGSVVLHGRVASLLEVGTGFHPELTGRENIFLNGSILGLKKREINQKLDAIIDFSGVEKFINMPLKHYSSGMQLRLAFSVAAHLEPEILLVDEVLAVGDIEFQKKCFAKMHEISTGKGRTILFVSHNLKAINEICHKAAFLNEGQLIALDNVSQVTRQYIEQMSLAANSVDFKNYASKQIFISHIKMYDENFQNKHFFNDNNKVGIGITVQNNSWKHPYTIGFGLNSLGKGRILISHKACDPLRPNTSEQFVVWLPTEELTPNVYTMDVSLLDDKKDTLDLVTNALSFEIALANTKFEGLGYDYGIMAKELTWQNL